MPRKVSRSTRDYLQEYDDCNAGNHDAYAEIQSERDKKQMQLKLQLQLQLQGLQQRAKSRGRCCLERGDLRGILLHHGVFWRVVKSDEWNKKEYETDPALELR